MKTSNYGINYLIGLIAKQGYCLVSVNQSKEVWTEQFNKEAVIINCNNRKIVAIRLTN